MKSLLIAALMAVTAGAFAQVPPGRLDTRMLTGARNYTEWEFERLNRPAWVDGYLSYNVTNAYDGLIFVRSNATVLVHVGLPNPTNNLYRQFNVHTIGAVTVVLTNIGYGGSFTDTFTGTNSTTSYFIQSNKTAQVYSSGSNYVVRLY